MLIISQLEGSGYQFCLVRLGGREPVLSFYRNRVYPHIVTVLGNPKPIQKIRQQLIPSALGTVLEIDVGPGVNFAYYDPTKVSKIYALEPNPGMVVRAEKESRASCDREASSCSLSMASRLMFACGAGKNGPNLSFNGPLKAAM